MMQGSSPEEIDDRLFCGRSPDDSMEMNMAKKKAATKRTAKKRQRAARRRREGQDGEGIR